MKITIVIRWDTFIISRQSIAFARGIDIGHIGFLIISDIVESIKVFLKKCTIHVREMLKKSKITDIYAT